MILNNILTSVIGYTELALDSKVDTETELEEYLQEVHTAGKRAKRACQADTDFCPAG